MENCLYLSHQTLKLPLDCLDIRAARTLLDNDHYAMDKLKRRVLEYLAVRQLKTSLKVCLIHVVVWNTFLKNFYQLLFEIFLYEFLL